MSVQFNMHSVHLSGIPKSVDIKKQGDRARMQILAVRVKRVAIHTSAAPLDLAQHVLLRLLPHISYNCCGGHLYPRVMVCCDASKRRGGLNSVHDQGSQSTYYCML
jgi:hypothetical protein